MAIILVQMSLLKKLEIVKGKFSQNQISPKIKRWTFCFLKEMKYSVEKF